jgi:hypothetical protein
VINCAIDESADRSRNNIIVVAGFAGATSHMRKLDRDWQADLAEHNLPHFHANELREHSSRLYRGISNRKREKLLSRLIGHIHKRTDWGLSAFIDSEYYKKNTSDRFRSQWGTAYTFAMRMLILTLPDPVD